MMFDPNHNFEWHERHAFLLANGASASTKLPNVCSRPFLPRDSNTRAWDGISTYFYSDNEETFATIFDRLQNNISPKLKVGKFSLSIVSPRYLPVKLYDLPPPKQYEYVLPLHCGWVSLT